MPPRNRATDKPIFASTPAPDDAPGDAPEDAVNDTAPDSVGVTPEPAGSSASVELSPDRADAYADLFDEVGELASVLEHVVTRLATLERLVDIMADSHFGNGVRPPAPVGTEEGGAGE